MSALHTALESLSATSFSDVPKNDLKPYLQKAFKDAQLLVDSVPLPDNAGSSSGGQNNASSASEMSESSARPSAPSGQDNESLQKAWGKPVSVKAAENPLGITVYKMAGKDKGGAWFARRSVHTGLGFKKWKKALEAEFPETMKVQGAPGEGNIRGIGGERRVECEEVKDLGKAEVYHLSAQFPGPTTPRDFVTLLITSEQALNKEAAGTKGDKIPRHFMVISRPCEHPDCPARDGFIRGQYQSVEFIREIVGDGDSDGENNPVEWIMVTRSDPGGSVPRFMIERGTPGGICGDAKSFLDWACSIDEGAVATEVPKDTDESGAATGSGSKGQDTNGQSKPSHHKKTQSRNGTSTGVQSPTVSTSTPPQQQQQSSGGLMSYVTGAAGAAGATMAAYTPDAIKSYLPGTAAEETTTTTTTTTQPHRRASISSTSSSESSDSFASASEGGRDMSTLTHKRSAGSTSTTTTASAAVQKLDDDKEEKAQKLETTKAKLSHRLSIEKEKSATKSGDTNESIAKAQAKYDKDVRKQEEKYRKEVEKIERKKAKEERKRQKEVDKELEKADKHKLQQEVEMVRRELEVTRADRDMYRGQVEELKSEVAKLMRGMGQVSAGNDRGLAHVASAPAVQEPVHAPVQAPVQTPVHSNEGTIETDRHTNGGEISLDAYLSK